VFITSLSSIAAANAGDINRVVKCDLCDDEDATEYCVECGEYFGIVCLAPHKRGKLSASHQQIPLNEVLEGRAAVKRIPRCQEHTGFEIDTHCRTCGESVCSRCITERHPKHDFCPLNQVSLPLQDQMAGYALTIARREEEAREGITTLNDTVSKIEEHRSAAEKDIARVFDAVAVSLEERRVQVLQQMHDKGDQLRKTAMNEKGEAESATVEFREFHTFTEGLLAQGTPFEIAGTHKMVRRCSVCLCEGVWLIIFLVILVVIAVQVQARNETLEKLQFPTQASVSPVFKFSAGSVDEVKKAISTLGSFVSQ